jgi:hypothetical protein
VQYNLRFCLEGLRKDRKKISERTAYFRAENQGSIRVAWRSCYRDTLQVNDTDLHSFLFARVLVTDDFVFNKNKYYVYIAISTSTSAGV